MGRVVSVAAGRVKNSRKGPQIFTNAQENNRIITQKRKYQCRKIIFKYRYCLCFKNKTVRLAHVPFRRLYVSEYEFNKVKDVNIVF